MTMIDGMATLVISSPDHPAYYVTQVFGLEPDWSAEKGDLRPRQGDQANEPIRRRVYDTSMWVLEVDSNPGTKMAMVEDDAKGFGTLQVLTDRLLGRGAAIAQIRADYKVELTWYGTAGGSQAGFMLPATLLADLAELGLDVFCTVYSHDDTSPRPGLHIDEHPQLPGAELVGNPAADAAAGAAEAGQAPEAAPEKTASQLAAEQLLVDSMIAQQLLEQQLSEREA
jgi:hypothetical protein